MQIQVISSRVSPILWLCLIKVVVNKDLPGRVGGRVGIKGGLGNLEGFSWPGEQHMEDREM